MTQPQEDSQYAKAIAYMSLSIFVWFFTFIYPNEQQIRGFESNISRGFCFFVIGYFICWRNGNIPTFKETQSHINLIKRNFCFATFAIVAGIAQFYMPLSVVHTICGSGPIFVFILDYYLNGVQVNGKQVVGLMMGIVGLVLTINGGILMKWIHPTYQTHSQFENYRTDNPLTIFLVSVLLAGVNVLWAYAQIVTKLLKDFDPFQIVYHTGIVSICVSSLSYCAAGQYKLTVEKFLMSLVLVGLPTFLALVLMIKAVQRVKKTGVVTIVSYFSVILGYLMSVFYYHETQNPICIVGVILIVVGVVRTIYSKDS